MIHSRLASLMILLFVAACGRQEILAVPQKSQLVSSAGSVDGPTWDALCKMHGAAAGCDLCEELSWYGDNVCDTFCPKVDPDCSGATCGDVPRAQLTATATSAEPGREADKAIDGTAATFWHTPWDDVLYQPTMALPQSVTLALATPTSVASLTYTPPEQANPNGIITSYVVAVSNDNATYTQVASGAWAEDATAKTVTFAAVTTSYVRLTALAGYGGFAAAGELSLGTCAAVSDPSPGTSAPLQGRIFEVSGNDSGAIAAANDAAGSGDTVFFGAGTYTLTATITLKPGVLYHAESGVELANATGDFAMRGQGVSDVIVDGVLIDGGAGIMIDGGSGISIINSTIQNNDLNGFGQGALFMLATTNTRIDHCTFLNDRTALMYYNVDDFVFTHNTVNGTSGNGVGGVLDDNATHTGIVFDSNTFDAIGRMGIEMIDDVNDPRPYVDGMQITNNTIGTTGLANGENIGISIVPCKSHGGVLIAGNHLTNTTGWGIEVCAPNGEVRDNVIDTPMGVAIACSPGLSIHDNVITNASEPFIKDGGYCGGETVGVNSVNGVEMNGSGF